MALTIKMRGLWAVLDRKGNYHAVAPCSHGIHHPVLVVKSSFIETDTSRKWTTWRPDFIGHIPTATGSQQIAAWNLLGRTISFSGSALAWKNRSRAIDFSARHKGASFKNQSEVENMFPKGCIANFNGGVCEPVDLKKFQVTQGKVSNEEDVATELQWSMLDSVITNEAGNYICFRRDEYNEEPVACLSNAAPIPSGLDHFHHYYELVDADPANRITLAAATEETYDCVPPIVGP